MRPGSTGGKQEYWFCGSYWSGRALHGYRYGKRLFPQGHSEGKSSTDTTVEEIMSTDLPRLSSGDTVEHCMQLMSSNNIRYLPVFSGDELKGIISMSDVVKETILMQQETIDHLQQYISL